MLPKLREPPEAYSEVASVAAVVQRNINSAAGIGFNGITGKIDGSRVGNLLAKLTGGEYDKTKWLLGEAAMASVTRSAVTDTIRENAKFHKEAGIHPYLRRYSRGKCCDWCDSMQGAWEYGEQPDDFWRIHKHCTCVIEYKPSKYKRADIIRYVTGEDGKISKVVDKGGESGKIEAGAILSDLADHPSKLGTYTPASLKKQLEENGVEVKPLSDGNFEDKSFEDGGGYKVNFDGDGLLMYHPEKRSHHGGAYYKISTGKKGIKHYDLDGKELKPTGDI